MQVFLSCYAHIALSPVFFTFNYVHVFEETLLTLHMFCKQHSLARQRLLNLGTSHLIMVNETVSCIIDKARLAEIQHLLVVVFVCTQLIFKGLAATLVL